MARDAPVQQGESASQSQQASKSNAASNTAEDDGPEYHDPLSGMSDADKFGIKGLTYMMQNFPDYAGLVTGSDITNLGFDLSSSE